MGGVYVLDSYSKLNEMADYRESLRKLRSEAQEHRKLLQQCTQQFIEEVIIPRLSTDEPLSVSELAILALDFKISFRENHPHDFLEFRLLSEAGLELAGRSDRERKERWESNIYSRGPAEKMHDRFSEIYRAYSQDLHYI